MPLEAEQAALLAGYQAQTVRLRGLAQSAVDEVFAQMVTFHAGDVDRMAELLAPVAEAAQQNMAFVTEAYLSQSLDAYGAPVAPGPAVDVSSVALRDVDARTLFARSGPTMWDGLKRGDSAEEAKRLGLQRVGKQMATNVQLAKTHTARSSLGRSDGVVGWRRVLNGPKNCALCVIASTQRYKRGDLAPIHPACDCSVTPIVGDKDPGWVIDPVTLESAHNAIKDQFGSNDGGARAINVRDVEKDVLRYRDVMLVRQHGEIGPVLSWEKHSFYKPTDRQ